MNEVSVYMPVYNSEKYLKESIQSVLSQTFENYEFIIIDDGSTDNSIQIIKSFKDKRIKLVRNTHDFIDSLNLGLKLSGSKYIARMDADDIMMPARLEVQYKFMEENQHIDVCSSWHKCFGDRNSVYATNRVNHDEIIESMIFCNPISNPTTMFRKSIIDKNNIRFNHQFAYAEDYKFWVDVSKVARFEIIPEILLKYRISENQLTTQKNKIISSLTKKIKREVAKEVLAKLNPSIKLPERLTFHFLKQLQGFHNADVETQKHLRMLNLYIKSVMYEN